MKGIIHDTYVSYFQVFCTDDWVKRHVSDYGQISVSFTRMDPNQCR